MNWRKRVLCWVFIIVFSLSGAIGLSGVHAWGGPGDDYDDGYEDEAESTVADPDYDGPQDGSDGNDGGSGESDNDDGDNE